MTQKERIERFRQGLREQLAQCEMVRKDGLDIADPGFEKATKMWQDVFNRLFPPNLPDEPAVLGKGEELCTLEPGDFGRGWLVHPGSWFSRGSFYAIARGEVGARGFFETKGAAVKAILVAGGRLLVRREE